MAECKACKKKLVDGARFCPFCGTPVNDENESVTVCKKCGGKFKSTFTFCPKCGERQFELPKPKLVEAVESIFRMMPIKGGVFQMGNADTRIVTVELYPFQMSNVPVTQELYQRIMGNNPSKIKGPNNPVDSVSWYDAVLFCNKLSKLHKYNACYTIGMITDLTTLDRDSQLWMRLTCNLEADGYRLPTEAEWEYAASGGGKKYMFAGSNDIDEVAWYGENSLVKSHPVAQKKPNSFGLYDMSGNVEEWCNDWYGEYKQIMQLNPIGSVSGTYRVKRGGGWLHDPEQCIITARSFSVPQSKGAMLGFRICRSGATADDMKL